MKMSQLIAAVLFSGIVSATAALADDAVVPQGGSEVKQQLVQDKAEVKADRGKLKVDREKLMKDRKAAHLARKGKKHNKKSQEVQPTEQPSK